MVSGDHSAVDNVGAGESVISVCDATQAVNIGALPNTCGTATHVLCPSNSSNYVLCILCSFRVVCRISLKEITHLRYFFENIVNNFHNTVFHYLFRNTYYFPN